MPGGPDGGRLDRARRITTGAIVGPSIPNNVGRVLGNQSGATGTRRSRLTLRQKYIAGWLSSFNIYSVQPDGVGAGVALVASALWSSSRLAGANARRSSSGFSLSPIHGRPVRQPLRNDAANAVVADQTPLNYQQHAGTVTGACTRVAICGQKDVNGKAFATLKSDSTTGRHAP